MRCTLNRLITTKRAPNSQQVDPAPGLHIWDSWSLRNRHGEVATIDGWQVLIVLTAPLEVAPGDRHDIAEHQYFVSRDGRNWLEAKPGRTQAEKRRTDGPVW